MGILSIMASGLGHFKRIDIDYRYIYVERYIKSIYNKDIVYFVLLYEVILWKRNGILTFGIY